MAGLPARSRRALEQLWLIATDASSAELLAERALTVLDTAVPFDDGALFGVDESTLLFNRLLAYRGQAPEAMRAWLRDTYLAVARAVARGDSDQDIAAALQLSVATVHEHVSALHRLLGTSTRPRLVTRLASGR
jgi:DNA-binding CsgD family transcriptional regulator